MGRYLRALTVCALLLFSSVASADELVIVSPHWEGVRYEFERAFNAERAKEHKPAVIFKWLDAGGTSEIIRFMRSQYHDHPDGIGVDLLFGGGIDPFIGLKQNQLLAPLKLSADDLAGVAQSVAGVPLHDPDGFFYAPTMSAFGILCNKVVLDQLHLAQPKTWEDLGSPQYKGWIGAADPRGSGSMHMSFEIILQAYGWDRGWQVIRKLTNNVRSFTANSTQVSKDVSNGETACGLAIDTQAWPLILTYGNERISFVIPEGLSVVNGDSVALLKGAPNPDLAREFVRFLFTKTAQRIWLQKKGSEGGPQQYDLSRFSVLPEIYAERAPTIVGVTPFELKSSLAYNFTLGASRWKLVNELLGVFVIDSHGAPVTAGNDHAPISEAEAQHLMANEDSLSPIEHSRLLHNWELSNDAGSVFTLWPEAVPSGIFIMILAAIALRRRRARQRRQ